MRTASNTLQMITVAYRRFTLAQANGIQLQLSRWVPGRINNEGNGGQISERET